MSHPACAGGFGQIYIYIYVCACLFTIIFTFIFILVYIIHQLFFTLHITFSLFKNWSCIASSLWWRGWVNTCITWRWLLLFSVLTSSILPYKNFKTLNILTRNSVYNISIDTKLNPYFMLAKLSRVTWRLTFQWLLHWDVGEGTTSFPGLLHFTLDMYFIMLSVKQGGIKYHFLSLWYDWTWDWTPVSRTIGEHSTH